MTKVEVFSTPEEANQKLTAYFTKNLKIMARILTELHDRHQAYRESAEFHQRHSGNKDAVLTPGETLKLSKGLGRGEAVTSLIKLYALDLHLYGFDYIVFNPENSIPFVPYHSIAGLTAAVREQIEQEKGGNIDLKNVPLFYTILKPFTHSEKNKQKVRKTSEYHSLSLENKLLVDQFLNNYLERGLTPVEIGEFVSGYVKFLN